MNIKIQIIIAVIVIFALCVIVSMIRAKKLELQYALAWLGVGTAILILDCFPSLISRIAHFIGIASPINMLFFFGFVFSLVIIFVLTVTISRMSVQIKNLAQALALYEKETNKQE